MVEAASGNSGNPRNIVTSGLGDNEPPLAANVDPDERCDRRDRGEAGRAYGIHDDETVPAGNRIVVIQPGNSREAIEDGDIINAVSPADTQELINIAKEVGENTRTITLDLKAISGKINRGQGIVGELLNDGEFSQELRRTVQSLKATGESTAKASAKLSELVYNMQHGDGLVPAMISDTSLKNTFQQTMANVKKVSSTAGSMSVTLDSVITKMNNSDNAIGVIMADTAFAHKLQRSMVNTENATLKLDENMEALKHSFLTRGYFKRKAKEDKKELEKIEADKALVRN